VQSSALFNVSGAAAASRQIDCWLRFHVDGAGITERTNEPSPRGATPVLIAADLIDSALTVAGCSHYPTAFADEVELGGPRLLSARCPAAARLR